MDVEDLIASMHVGREGYELKALQAHLSKTLNYNPDNVTLYQPVQGVHYVPPPPVSSLNSMASTSYGTSYHQFPIHPNLNIQPGRTSRPQCTPAHSYRGFQPEFKAMEEVGDAQDHDMDVEMDIGRSPNQHKEQRSMFSSPPGQYDERDFGAFSADAFAPPHQHGQMHGSSLLADGQDHTDVWSSFRKGTGTSAIPNDQARCQTGLGAAIDSSKSNRWEPDAISESDENSESEPAASRPDRNSAGTWTSGRLRNTAAREKRRVDKSTPNHKS